MLRYYIIFSNRRRKLEIGVSWWIGFHVFVFCMLALDLGVINKHEREISIKESLIWTGVWIALALAFNYGILHYFGKQYAGEFLTDMS